MPQESSTLSYSGADRPEETAKPKMCECGKQTEQRCHNPPYWQFIEFGCLWACRPVSER